MSAARFPRGAAADLPDQVPQSAPILVTGPPGRGQDHAAAARPRTRCAPRAGTPVYLDLMGAASSPERFVRAAVAGAARAAARGRARRGRRPHPRPRRGRQAARGADGVRALFDLWSSLDEAGGRPVALLLDEATEIRSLAYFAGLRDVDAPFAAALGARPRGTILATSMPTAARRLWPALSTLPLEPIGARELAPALSAAGIGGDAERAGPAPASGCRATCDVLLDAVRGGGDVERAWAAGMARGGRLERLCRHTYETLLLRSRGYGMSKAVLGAVAEEEGLNLTALVGPARPLAGRDPRLPGLAARRGRAAHGAASGTSTSTAWCAWWVRLHGGGVIPTDAQLEAAARAVTAGAARAAEPALAAAAPQRAPDGDRLASRTSSMRRSSLRPMRPTRRTQTSPSRMTSTVGSPRTS